MKKIRREFLMETLIVITVIFSAVVFWLLVKQEKESEYVEKELSIDSLRQIHKDLRDTVSLYEDGF